MACAREPIVAARLNGKNLTDGALYKNINEAETRGIQTEVSTVDNGDLRSSRVKKMMSSLKSTGG